MQEMLLLDALSTSSVSFFLRFSTRPGTLLFDFANALAFGSDLCCGGDNRDAYMYSSLKDDEETQVQICDGERLDRIVWRTSTTLLPQQQQEEKDGSLVGPRNLLLS
ncbi:hypothetical protein SETIT_2G438300v2 [Setaria italica]|uniref:Uncharacterized protein n=1 Tax=Setaria italica TaxID=4555 RepID=A0A368Q9C7_SETIT|nr:hypothetical protein SETIT_2G438300v2 [Setaria italica]